MSKSKKTAEEWGREGGKKTLEKYGKNHFSEIAKRRHRKKRKRAAKT